jgi:hypothetical protein
MNRAQIAILLARAETWPQEAQEELIRSALDIDRKNACVYQLDDAERADVREGLAEIERGEVT